jgi:protein FAM50
LLSFGDDEDDVTSSASTPGPGTPRDLQEHSPDPASLRPEKAPIPRRLTPNPNAVLPAPKVMTKAALQAEVIERDKLRREFLALQEAVKATEILIPFVFYDGTNIPGGTVRVKKGDHVWLFLDRCRKVGAELGVAGGGGSGTSSSGKSKNDSRREWARVGIDDLMLVRGELIIPHVSIFSLSREYYQLTADPSTTSSTTSLPIVYQAHPNLGVFCSTTQIQYHKAQAQRVRLYYAPPIKILKVKIMIQP